ncbi:hypothetical protein LCM20_16620 [Halobacillus litoralis]|uniref:hypothetical protein n=1 Tax=Halobacillus litoralis TaxID=45668 RepID=UPI001CD6E343|nr:hypothetical protein [Halobacillus litoralis]MCA0972234.1 hypothetical protein [Halobacillus litoralis]
MGVIINLLLVLGIMTISVTMTMLVGKVKNTSGKNNHTLTYVFISVVSFLAYTAFQSTGYSSIMLTLGGAAAILLMINLTKLMFRRS